MLLILVVIDRDRPRGYAQNVALVLQTASYTSVSSLGSRSGDTEVEKEITAYRYVRALVMACIPIDGETAAYVQNTCVASPIKKKKPILRTNPRLEAPLHLYLPPFFYVRCFVIPPNSSLTSNPKAHHPAICSSLVLSLRTVWQSGSSFRVL